MVLKGNAKMPDEENKQEDLNEDHESENASQRFRQELNINEHMSCIVMHKSGYLKMNGCTLSLDGIQSEFDIKVPALTMMSGAQLELVHSNFKGDSVNSTSTCGLVMNNPESVLIRQCYFSHYKSGAILMDLEKDNKV
mmetsp:Transcript_7202/g.6305  ORF Transcript_7202/g.6305 Transcript_7202/m.6305 type:complete len:138 (+) Transcript_7202:319-732(+)